jgi:hypothetical protein
MTEAEKAAADSRSLDCAGSFAIANDPASLGMTNQREILATDPDEMLGMTDHGEMLATDHSETFGMTNYGGTLGATDLRATNEPQSHGIVIPWIQAVADPREKWWELRRNSPKQSGEISQAAFLLRARQLGFKVALPWGDSERYDFVVWMEGGPMYRVQVKGTGRLYRRGYEVQPVHSTRGGGKQRYTAKEIDVVAAHVQPVDVWYLLPIKKVGRAKSLRLYPDIESRRPMWEEYREAWEVLGYRGAGNLRGRVR